MKVKLFNISLILFLITVFSCAGNNKTAEYTPKVNNATYQKNCSTCHFAYQPGLLPAGSWKILLEKTDAHAGGPFSFDDKTMNEIKNYLIMNSAEKSGWEKAGKILSSTISETPVRISEISYIKRKHWGVRNSIFQRSSIGSRGNCIACHKSAETGLYDEDDVKIPD